MGTEEKNNIQLLREDIADIKTTVDKISWKLFTDSETGEQGYFEKQRKNTEDIRMLKNVKSALLVLLSLANLGIGILMKKYLF